MDSEIGPVKSRTWRRQIGSWLIILASSRNKSSDGMGKDVVFFTTR